MIRVRYYAGIRELAGVAQTCVEGFSGTFAELLRHLEERHGITVINPSAEEGSDPLSDLILMVNGRHIAYLGGLDALVSDGDSVSIFPMVNEGLPCFR